MKYFGLIGIVGLILIIVAAIFYLIPGFKTNYPELFSYSWKAVIVWGIILAIYYVVFLIKKS